MLEKINLKPLSEDEIVQKEYTLEELWLIQYEGNTTGPFHTSDLKSFTSENPEIMEHFVVTNLLKNQFAPFYSYPQFQRREPKLVQASSLVSDEMFLVLKDGQKHGPISYEELKASLDNNEFKLSDQLSVDKGQSWIKIYEHHQFDRRSRAVNAELPFIPNEDLLNQAISNGEELMQKAMNFNEEQDALAGLAFLSHGKEHVKNAENFQHSNSRDKSERQNKTRIKFISAFAVLSVIVLSSILGTKTNETLNSPEPVKTVVKAIDNTNRAPKRVPASVKKTYKPLVSKKAPVFKPVVPKKRTPPKRYVRKSVKKAEEKVEEPRRITHFADEFDRVDTSNPDEQDRLDRDLASDEEGLYPEDELTDDQIEAIELGDPRMLEDPRLDREDY